MNRNERAWKDRLPGLILDAGRNALHGRTFIKSERRLPLSFYRPDMYLRGYHSVRAWMYPDWPSRHKGYITDFDYLRTVRFLNPREVQRAFVDKNVTAERLKAGGLGEFLPKTLGQIVDGDIRMATVRTTGPVALKRADGHGGHGFEICESFEGAIRNCPPEGSFIVQEKVEPHSYGRDIYPASLNTLRVLIIRPRPGARPLAATATHRFGTSNSGAVDGFSAGGLISRVALDHGTLSPGLSLPTERKRIMHTLHPDTGTRIADREVPHFGDAIALAVSAMACFPSAAYVGWDIAISRGGPIIMEGNGGNPSVGTLQAHGPFASSGPVRDYYRSVGLLP